MEQSKDHREKLDARIEAERLEKRFGKYRLGRNALEAKIQEILDNSNPTNFLRAMRLAELLANDFENVEQVGYENVLKHLNYTLVSNNLDYLSRSQQSKWERKAERLEKRIAEKDRQLIKKEFEKEKGNEEMNIKDKLFNFLGVAGVILYYLFCLIIWVLPLIMIDVPFVLTVGISLIMMFIPISAGIFYIWALICTIQGPQDIFAIIFYIVFALLFLPYFIETLSDFIKKVLHK